jgi:hypothetical protein
LWSLFIAARFAATPGHTVQLMLDEARAEPPAAPPALGKAEGKAAAGAAAGTSGGGGRPASELKHAASRINFWLGRLRNKKGFPPLPGRVAHQLKGAVSE